MIGERFQPKAAFRALRIIFYALNTGLLLFFIVAIYLSDMQLPPFKEGFDILTYVNVVLLASIPAGYSISSKRIDVIDAGDSFSRKFEQLQGAMIIRWAMIEGTAIFSLVGLIVLQDSKQLVLFVICILVLSSNTVTKEKVTRMAKLNPEESRALDD
jgi:F0F1-type ATP synthase membrane subunit c/vacuolar-type H+-ATPase subunit K